MMTLLTLQHGLHGMQGTNLVLVISQIMVAWQPMLWCSHGNVADTCLMKCRTPMLCWTSRASWLHGSQSCRAAMMTLLTLQHGLHGMQDTKLVLVISCIMLAWQPMLWCSHSNVADTCLMECGPPS